MTKTFPLIKANLKGFVRNWKSIIILVILPLVLISIIFASFNPNGIRKINMGYTLAENQTLDEAQLRGALSNFARLTRYDTLDECTRSLRSYREYVCVEVKGRGPFVLDVYYDNTREPVIWEIVQRLEQGIRSIQKQHSKTIASEFLTRFRTAMDRLDLFDQQLGSVNRDLDSYVRQVDDSVIRLHSARRDLVTSLDDMDRDIADAKLEVSDARSSKNMHVANAYSNLQSADTMTRQAAWVPEQQPYSSMIIENIGQARSTVRDMDQQVEDKLVEVDGKLNNYGESSRRGRQYIFDIDTTTKQLESTKSELRQYQQRVRQTQEEMDAIKEEFSLLTTVNADTLVNPVIIRHTATYVPPVDERTAGLGDSPEAASKGISLISLQTVFPTVLILITIFLSLLIGSFVALSEISSSAHTRLRLVRNIFLPEFFASFLSALIIVLIPAFLVLIVGDQIFNLGLLAHLVTTSAMLVLVMAIFVLLGFLLAYIIRKESITLMTSTFVLVLLIFFSGFLLPIERMSPLFGAIAEYSPGALATSMFKQSVFYGAGFSAISAEFSVLIVEFVVLLFVTLTVRYFRER